MIIFLCIQAALGLNVKYKEISALTGDGVEDVSLYHIIIIMWKFSRDLYISRKASHQDCEDCQDCAVYFR